MKITKKSYEKIIDTMNDINTVKVLKEKLNDRDEGTFILANKLNKSLEGK